MYRPDSADEGNLAALCLQCHDDTQIRGGFGRKLNAAQVIQYRDDWVKRIAEIRAARGRHIRLPSEDPPAPRTKSSKAKRIAAPTTPEPKREGGNSNSKLSNRATWLIPQRVLDSG
jgi:hypothetical protein